jgi:uncharacterized membrane protein
MFNMTKQEMSALLQGVIVGMLIANISSGEWVDVGFIVVLLLLTLLVRHNQGTSV